jgi:hypothetical protein
MLPYLLYRAGRAEFQHLVLHGKVGLSNRRSDIAAAFDAIKEVQREERAIAVQPRHFAYPIAVSETGSWATQCSLVFPVNGLFSGTALFSVDASEPGSPRSPSR